MNIQEAYRKLDLAQGVELNRVLEQYNKLKSEMENKVAITKNAKLRALYENRLTEIEAAFLVLKNSFNVQQPKLNSEPKTESKQEVKPEQENKAKPQAAPENKNENKKPVFTEINASQFNDNDGKGNPGKKVLIVTAIILGICGLAYLGFLFFKKPNPFYIMENEKHVFVNNLFLREYADAESREIKLFPFGSRLVLTNDPASYDALNRTWRKAKVMHEEYGWEKPYEGWVCVDQCGQQWIVDSSKFSRLNSIIENKEASDAMNLRARTAVLNYFNNNNLSSDWKVSDYSSEQITRKIKLNIFGSEPKDCNGDAMETFLIIIENKSTREKKLLVFSYNQSQMPNLIYEDNCSDCMGFKNADGYQKQKFRRNSILRYNPLILEKSGAQQDAVYVVNGVFNRVSMESLYY